MKERSRTRKGQNYANTALNGYVPYALHLLKLAQALI